MLSEKVKLMHERYSDAALAAMSDEELEALLDEVKPMARQCSYQRFMEYNCQDVNLVKRIDEKKKLFNLVFALAYLMRANYEDTLATVRPWSSFAYFDLLKHGVQPEIHHAYSGDIEFVGGYVKEPVPGRRKWIVSVDFQSLYPHIMMGANLGPETILTDQQAYKVRQMLLEELAAMPQTPHIIEYQRRVKANKSIHDIFFEEPVEFKCLKELDICMAPNMSFYTRNKMSLWGRIMREVYDGRKRVKKKMLGKEQELENAKNSGATAEVVSALENEVAGLDSLQHGYKIAMNSCYGALSNKWFVEYFDLRVAEAITTYGQLAIQYGGFKINEYLNGILGTNQDWIITQDTDSAYIDMSGLVEKMFGKDPDPTRVVDFLDKVFKDKMEGLFEQWFDELCGKLNCYENKFVFKREVIAPVGIWTAKKRYAALVVDSEGVRYEKPKMKYIGLEAKKSSTPKHCRNWLVECYGLAMTADESVLHKRVAEIKKEFMSKPIEDIAAPRSVNNMEKYRDTQEIYVKGTPKHVKAALFHNFLVERVPEANNVGLISSGDKIKYVELKRNKYGFEVIGFQGFLPKEFGLDAYVDKQTTFQKTFLDPLQIFLNAVKWNYEPKASVMDFFV